jgi:prepilin-type N-terminal cleavage/methylation domain-containing protein
MTYSWHMLCRKNRGFSLVELLAVVGIMSLLATLTMPALMSSRKASILTHAGNSMADMASMARQSSLSRNVITALVISSKATDDPSTRQAARVLQYDGMANSWMPLGGWIRLPESVSVQDNAPDTSAMMRLAEPGLKVDGATLTDYTAFVFYPDSHMDSMGATRELLVTSSTEPTARNFYKLVFNSDTSAFLIVRP